MGIKIFWVYVPNKNPEKKGSMKAFLSKTLAEKYCAKNPDAQQISKGNAKKLFKNMTGKEFEIYLDKIKTEALLKAAPKE